MLCLLFQSIFVRSRFDFEFPLGHRSRVGTHSSAHGLDSDHFHMHTGWGLAGWQAQAPLRDSKVPAVPLGLLIQECCAMRPSWRS